MFPRAVPVFETCTTRFADFGEFYGHKLRGRWFSLPAGRADLPGWSIDCLGKFQASICDDVNGRVRAGLYL